MISTTLDTYANEFENVSFERDEAGVLVVTFHTQGDSLVWTLDAHEEIATAWDHVARDRENRVVIVTGSGDTFVDRELVGAADDDGSWYNPAMYLDIMHAARRLVLSQLDIEVPMIAAVNGHNRIHSEQAFMCDIVLAAEGSKFADACHFLVGVPPSDGIQVMLPLAIGLNRARALMLTGAQFTAEEAHDWGAVWEVLPKADLLRRARELASSIAAKPDVVLRTSRALMTAPLKRAMLEGVATGLPTGGFSLCHQLPTGLNPWASADG